VRSFSTGGASCTPHNRGFPCLTLPASCSRVPFCGTPSIGVGRPWVFESVAAAAAAAATTITTTITTTDRQRAAFHLVVEDQRDKRVFSEGAAEGENGRARDLNREWFG